jgi:hypothetical protein
MRVGWPRSPATLELLQRKIGKSYLVFTNMVVVRLLVILIFDGFNMTAHLQIVPSRLYILKEELQVGYNNRLQSSNE